MNCPYCGGSMIPGRIETNAVLHLIRWPASIIFEPDEYYKKKKTASPLDKREGWYCEHCRKIVGVFDVSR